MMNRKNIYISIALIYFGISLFLTLATAFQSNKLVGKKHPGFLVYNNGMVFGLVDKTWSGHKAGLEIFDRITHFDNQEFTSTKQLFDHINAHNSKRMTYRITRNEKPMKLLIKTTEVTENFATIYFNTFLIIGLLTMVTGICVFLLRPLAKGAFLFFIVCNTLGIFEALFADMMGLQNHLFILTLGICAYAVANTHMIVSLLLMKRKFRKQYSLGTQIGLTLFYLSIFAAGIGIYQLAQVYTPYFKTILLTTNSLFLIAGVSVYIAGIYLYFTSQSYVTRRRLLVFFSLNVSCLITYIVYTAQNVFLVLFPVELILLQLCFPLVVTYVIFHYNFLNFNFLPKRKIFYWGIFFTTAILFIIDFIYVIPILHKYNVNEKWIFPIIIGSLTLKLGILIYTAYTRLIDRVFFPSTFKFRDTMRDASEYLNLNNKEEILQALCNLLIKDLNIQDVFCYLSHHENGDFHKQNLNTSDDTQEFFDSLPHTLSSQDFNFEHKEYSLNEFSSNPKVLTPQQNFLSQHKLNLMLPLKFKERVIGVMIFGPKPNLLPYSSEDLTNLQALLATCSVALINAKHEMELMKIQEKLRSENKWLKKESQNRLMPTTMIGEQTGLKQVFAKIGMIAHNDISVLLLGETGTGKEVIARIIHERSQRSEKTLVKVNCAAIPENLFESELFGHEKGSFTGATERKKGVFEYASGGTLFLDEIGEIPINVQAKLLRALQEKEIQRVGSAQMIPVDVRIIAATNRNLENEVKKKKFREDLFYRLNVLPIHIPSLRERREDIDELVQSFIRRYSLEMKKHIPPLKKSELNKLMKYSWPGNIRELQNVIERSVALCEDGQELTLFNPDEQGSVSNEIEEILESGDFYKQMEVFKKKVIEHAIAESGGNKAQAARILGVHQVSLYKMIKQLGI